jgi:hypothetical protein
VALVNQIPSTNISILKPGAHGQKENAKWECLTMNNEKWLKSGTTNPVG